jgi:hypothetical protein
MLVHLENHYLTMKSFTKILEKTLFDLPQVFTSGEQNELYQHFGQLMMRKLHFLLQIFI